MGSSHANTSSRPIVGNSQRTNREIHTCQRCGLLPILACTSVCFNVRSSPSQAYDEGSIPFTRSTFLLPHHLNGAAVRSPCQVTVWQQSVVLPTEEDSTVESTSPPCCRCEDTARSDSEWTPPGFFEATAGCRQFSSDVFGPPAKRGAILS